MQSTAAVDVLTALASAEDPQAARKALRVARRVLGSDAGEFGPLLELLCRRASEIARLRRLAGSDELTGAANRRSFNQSLDREMARHGRGGRGPSVLFLDLDGLKLLNDTLGHEAGDEAIIATSDALTDSVRATDLVARFGGDEFAILLPETDEAGAQIVADRVRAAVEAKTVRGRNLQISVGFTGSGPFENSSRSMLQRADDALYEDKRSRRQAAA